MMLGGGGGDGNRIPTPTEVKKFIMLVLLMCLKLTEKGEGGQSN